MKEFKENFHIEGTQKLVIDNKDEVGRNASLKRRVTGNVISQDKDKVTLQLENYKESFTIASFFVGEVCVAN